MPPTRHAFSTNQEILKNEDFVQTTSANNLWEENTHLEHSKTVDSTITNSPSTSRILQPTFNNMTLSANPNSFSIPSHPSDSSQPANPSFHLFPTSNFDSQGSASSSFLSGTSPWSNEKSSYDLFGASHPFSEVFGFPESSSRRGSEASIEESFNSIGRSRRGSSSSVDMELQQPLSRRGSLSSDPWGPSSRTSTPGPQPNSLNVSSYNFANEHGLNGATLSHINALTSAYTGLGSDSRRGSLGSDLDFEFGGHMDYPKIQRVPSSNQRSTTASPSIDEDMFGMEPFDPQSGQFMNNFANLNLGSNSSNSGMDMGGSSSPTPYAMYDGHAVPGSTVEHPLGEHPSRTLFVRNIDSNVEDEELSALFEQYGPKRSMYTQCKHRGFVMISYYDIRHAKNAMKHLQGKLLKRRKLDIHYSIPKDNPSEKDLNQGTLVVFNLDPSITNEELKNIFGVYGEIKEIRETPNKKHHKFIEFYDIRDAERAMKNLNKTEIRGKKIKIEPSRPGGARKGLLQQGVLPMSNPGSYEMSSFPNSFEDELENLPTALLNADQDSLFSNTALLSGSRSDNSSTAFNASPSFASSSPNFAQHAVSRGFSSPGLATSPLNPLTQSKSTGSINFQPSSSSSALSPIGTPLQTSSTSPGYSSGFSTTISSASSSYGFSVANNNNVTAPNVNDINNMPTNSYRNAVTKSRSSTIPFSPTTQSPSNSPPRNQGFISPRTAKSPLMWNGPSVQSAPQNTPPNSGFVGSPLERQIPSEGTSPKSHSEISAQRRRSDSIEDKTKFSLNLHRVRNGEDKRTTLMIRNIPNKYNQKMLLSTVDETHKGTYDFFYLPIDFKNKCNVGYAFINFINCQTIISFYENFNNKKWEKFNSEKVCEIAYARIQGKHGLISHFQNSSLMVEDKKCRPMIFYSDGPNMGEPEPFPVGTNVRRRGSLGGRDDKPTNLSFSEYPLKNE